MSVVWRAADEILGRPVAVKILKTDQASDEAIRTIVLSEAKAAARIAHPNVAGVFDYGESVSLDGTTVPYVVMELLEGPSLAQRLASGPLEPRSALWVATELAAGLAAAHDVGLVHRDVKPGNVILALSGTKMVDFGIAAIAGEPDGIDADGRVLGTRPYLPPERLSRGVVVPASDMYAWGVLLHCILTGRPPWPDDATMDQRVEHLRRADALPGVPAAIDDVFRRCLDPDPSARPTAHEAALVVGAAAGVSFALGDVPRQSLAAGALDAPTAHLRPRAAVQLGPGKRKTGATAGGKGDTKIDMYPAPPPPPRFRAWVIAGALAAVIVSVIVAGTLLALFPDQKVSQAPTTGPLASPTHTTPPITSGPTTRPTTGAPAARVTLTSAGGRVVASCDGGLVRVESATPAPGFDLHDDIPGPDREVEVRFRNDSSDVRMIVRCSNGSPEYSLKD
jgi:serine/threonine-protein kinase